MQIANREGFAATARKRLPYDAEVEYLQSTGTQWIDTGVLNDANVKMNFRIRPSSVSGTYFMGVDAGLVFGTNNGINFRANGVSSVDAFNTNTFYAIEMYYNGNRRFCVIDGSETLSNTVSRMLDKNILLFATSGGVTIGPIAYYLPWSISDCKMWNGSAIVRDFIPVRVGATGEMYDRITGTFATRVGTFIVGPDTTA